MLAESDVEGKESKFLCKETWQCAARTQISCRDGHTSKANKRMSNKHGLVGARSNSRIQAIYPRAPVILNFTQCLEYFDLKLLSTRQYLEYFELE